MESENPDNAVERDQSAKHSDSKATDHPQETKTTTPPVAAPSTTQPCCKHPEITYNTKRDWIDKLTLGLEAFGLLVLIVYTVATIAIWRANKKAADAATDAARAAKIASETAQKQLEQSERPWLKVSFVVQPPGITFTNGGMQLNISPRIENIGHSVATSVVSPMQIFLADDADTMFNEPLKRQKESCEKLAKQPVQQPGSMAVVIFPNDSDSSVGYGLSLTKKEVDAAKDGRIGVTGANMTGPKLLVPIVYGCVDYMFATSERHHQTQFILELQQTNRISTVPKRIPVIAIRAGQPVDASNVVITKYPFGGFYAY